MTQQEKYEVFLKWCSFCEDEGEISQEELNVLWELADNIIPHVVTLEKAKKLEPHTPVWVEIKQSSGETSLHLWQASDVTIGGKYVRIWMGAWPSPELRSSTPWEVKT